MLRSSATRDRRACFAGLSLDGSVLKQDADDNEKLYGRKVSVKEILIDVTVRTPLAARGLDSTLAKIRSKGRPTVPRLLCRSRCRKVTST
jgi:lipid-binding SYLF domain-containing protein